MLCHKTDDRDLSWTCVADYARQKRDHWIQERKSDPAVMVDIPQTPGPEELEKSGAMAADGLAEVLADATAQTQSTKA